MAGGKKSTANQELAAARLAAGGTVADAATASKSSERTIANWLNDPGFRRRVDELRSAAVGRALALISDSMTEAAQALRLLLTSANETVKLRAAVAMLDLGLNAVEVADVKRQLAALEAELRGANGGGS